MSVSHIPIVTELKPEDPYDVIFVVMRYTQIEAILDTLRANRTKNIIFVGNNVRARAVADLLPEKNVMFAFASSAGHREPNRVASVDLKKITIGQLLGAPSNEELIGQIFEITTSFPARNRFLARLQPSTPAPNTKILIVRSSVFFTAHQLTASN